MTQINSLLLASLLLHLGIILALTGGYRPDHIPHPKVSPVLVYLDSGSAVQSAAKAMPRQGAAPGGSGTGRAGLPLMPAASGGVSSGPPVPQQDAGIRPQAAIPKLMAPAAAANPVSAAIDRIAPAAVGRVAPAAVDRGLPATVAGAAPTPDGSAASKASGAGTHPGAATGRAAGVNQIAAHRDGSRTSAPGTTIQRRDAYQAKLRSLVEAHKEYPLAARKAGREGSCQRRLVLARDGALKRVEALTSCGHPFLDAAATGAITGVGSFPPLPEEFGGIEESFTIIMTFTLTRR